MRNKMKMKSFWLKRNREEMMRDIEILVEIGEK